MAEPRAIILVEGTSDKLAVETLAARRGRDLTGDGVEVTAIGGAQAVGRYVRRLAPSLILAGLCDAGEEPAVARALERAGRGQRLDRAGLEWLGFFVCERDLEDELVCALGVEAVEAVFAAHGILRSFRTYQKQAAHRDRPIEDQLRGFLNNWKVRLAGPLVEALDMERVPRPLEAVLAYVEFPARGADCTLAR